MRDLLAMAMCVACLGWGSASECQDAGHMPNGTATTMHWFNCMSGVACPITDVKVTDGEGNPNYPIDINKPIVLAAKGVNNGVTYNTLLVDVTIAYWGNLLSSDCHWITIPTFGLLNNLDGCAVTKNCPVQPGPISFTQQLDLSPYASIISQLGGGVVYQIELHVKNGDSAEHEIISCGTSQGLMANH